MDAGAIDPDFLAEMAACLGALVIGSFVGICVHEGGHALAALVVGLEPRAIVIGHGPLVWRHRVRRTWLVLRALPIYGYSARLSDPDGRREAQALVVAAGPFASLLLCAGASIGVAMTFEREWAVASQVCLGIAIASGTQLVSSIWPRHFKVKGRPGAHLTDGGKLLKLARGGEIDQFHIRYARLLRSVLDEAEAGAPPSVLAPELLYQLSRSDKREAWARLDMGEVLARLLHEPELSDAERQFLVRKYKLDPLDDAPA